MQLPKSPTSMRINAFGLLCSLLTILWLRESDFLSPSSAMIIAGLALALPIIILEWIFLKPYKNNSAGLNFKQKNSGSIKRTIIKLIGFYACLLFVAFIYWLFPEYRGGYYDNFFILLRNISLALCLVAIPYFYLIDRAMVNPKDS
ncbi:MAG: isoprenylcysteine carboxyl methyltransferase, partial [Psychromonas sp.]|nr:isoprenylcysteine carboxyl methyltransferase [Psychromonas sp.]